MGIVTVTYFPGSTITTFLDSIANAAMWPASGGDPFVVVADNGSTDGSLEKLRHRTDVRIIETGSNLGFGGGANRGVAALPPSVDWVLICNSDLHFEPGAIAALIAAADRYPAAGSLGPLLLTPEGEVYPSARELPSIGRGIGHAVFGWIWPRNPWTKAYRRDHDVPSERTAGWLSGACLMVRRSAWNEIGGFDTSFFMFFEDVDLGDRLGQAGWQNVYVPSARVTHIGGHSTKRHRPEMAAAHHHSAYRYLARRYSKWWQAPLRWALRAGLRLRSELAKRSTAVGGGADLPK